MVAVSLFADLSFLFLAIMNLYFIDLLYIRMNEYRLFCQKIYYFISILLILKLHKLFVTSLFISVKLKKYIKKISQVYYQNKFSNKKKQKRNSFFAQVNFELNLKLRILI
jgi:hypothetical protein